MPRATIYYFTEDIEFKLPDPQSTTDWIRKVIRQEGYQLISLNFIFCSDNYLYAKNLEYLHHDTLTDVITFSYAEKPQTIEGEIYMSIERVRDNASRYTSSFWDELYTVMIHGVLHLLGYKDDTLAEKETMREKERACLLVR
ncbi:MAG: rRNA maturation RNase YbeY [Candidatus Amoebophilus sp. 36-38]|nr:MAG: rRNA maturation RNase YbeY [Candidatus Amoebophilus sp. 36-38]